ncbi:MAG: transcriptional regulator [Fluviicola sp.]|nr:MAG: transcriptional regulator [Fluviicola sp.]
MAKHVIRLKEIMQEKNIPRDTLAEAMGVAPATISNISTGKVYPSVKFLIEVSEYLDVDIREMFVSTKGGVLTSVDKQKLKDVLNEGINLLNS